MLPLTTPEALDEDKAIQELSMGHQCLIQLRCLLKGMNWNNNSLQQRVDTLSGRALQGFQVGLSFLTSASSKTLGAGSSNAMPNVVGLSDPVLNANFNNKRERSTGTGGTNSTFSNKRAKTSASGGTNSTFRNNRAKASASGDINSSDKGKRICDLDWTKTADPDLDGKLWAKYSQRPIKGRKHPRNYYKCKHNGCSAVKRVQQCDNTDPPMFSVAYDNEHTCNTAAGIAPLPTPAATPPPPVATPPPPVATPPHPFQHELQSPINSAAKDSSPKVSLLDTNSTAKNFSAKSPLWCDLFLQNTHNDLDILKMPLESEIGYDTRHFFAATFLEQAAPDSWMKTTSPAFHISSASGSCPSLSLNDNSFPGELNSRPSNSDFSSCT